MPKRQEYWVVAAILCSISTQATAIELQRTTLDEWEEYVRNVDSQMQARLRNDKPFLWIDESPHRYPRLRDGDILVQPVIDHGIKPVTGGLIHHWIGAIYIPNATNAGLVSITGDYDRYSEIYRPVVTSSRSLRRDGAYEEFSMTWQRKVLFVSAAVQGHFIDYEIAVDSHRGYDIVNAISLQQIENRGLPEEQLLPPDTGSGFIWRIRSIARYEERDDGVYLELEVIALTRNIPNSMRWLVSPIVNRLSVSALTTTLLQTREAVKHRRTLAAKQ